MAGLTVAHELAERGFAVTVHEAHELGGKARSIPVPGSASGGRNPLPGEHGYRFVPGFYQHLPDTMRRIPTADGRHVWDHMVGQAGVMYARAAGREALSVMARGRGPRLGAAGLRRNLIARLQQMRALPPQQALTFFWRFLVFLTSSDERRLGQWEYTTWWDFLRAGEQSEEYRKVLVDGLSQRLVAARGDLASTRAIGVLSEAYVFAATGLSTTGEIGRVLDAPTSESWIGPWVDHLRSLGVRFVLGSRADGLLVEDGVVTKVRFVGPAGATEVEADWVVVATPVDAARSLLLTEDLLALDPSLAGLDGLRTEWMNGIQFYLTRATPIVDGPVDYVDSPWALVSGSQAQWWNRDLARDYGDGRVRDCLSVNIADFDAPGVLFGKPAKECTPDEIAAEVLAQMRAALDGKGRHVLPDEAIHSWFLDPALSYSDGRLSNTEPLIVGYVGSWDNKPDAATGVPNLFIAGDYVRDNLSCATMESANQTGRMAANALLAAAGSTADPAAVHEVYCPRPLRTLRRLDAQRYRRGRRHVLDRPRGPIGPICPPSSSFG